MIAPDFARLQMLAGAFSRGARRGTPRKGESKATPVVEGVGLKSVSLSRMPTALAVFVRRVHPRAARLIILLLGAATGLVQAASGAHDHPRSVVLAPGYADLQYEPPPPGSYRLPPLGLAGDGAVLDSGGGAVRVHDLLGEKIVVLSFIYTACTDINGCPLASHVLRGVQNRLLQTPGLRDRVRLVSFSFDPANDTPEVLSRYSGYFKKPEFDWRFLTCGSEQELAPILDRFGQWVIKDYDNEGNYLGTISHMLRVYLIDRAKRIRNIYSLSFLHADTLINDIRTLEMEAARQHVGLGQQSGMAVWPGGGVELHP